MCKAPWVLERSPSSDPNRLTVAFDATPLLGQRTGVGAFCVGALEGLALRSELAVSAYAVSWRRRAGISDLVPEGVSTRQRAMPARPLQWAWAQASFPPIEWFVGGHDVVHGTNYVVPPTSRAARVVTVFDLTVILYPELCDPPTLQYPALIRRAVAEGAWLHTSSQFIADQIVAEFAIEPERVRVVHLGIPALSGTDPGIDGLPIDLPKGCGRYVLAIGTVEPRKDYPLLVRAFDRLASDHPDVALVIVGGDGWGAERLADALSAASHRGRVVRAGYLDDRSLATVLRRAAVLAYPSLYEGFGFPPLQAMAAGVPVVATAAGSVPEVVGDGALLVDPADADALAGALSRVLAGGAEVEELIVRGKRRASEFTWEECAAGLVSLYRAAVHFRGGRAGRHAAGGTL